MLSNDLPLERRSHFFHSMRVPMTRPFRDPHVRVPNFGIEGPLPRRWPEWVDPNWRIIPPAPPPWSPPPLSPQDGTDPFGDSPGTPPSLQPRLDDMQRRADSDLIDWLFKTYRADREESARQLPWSAGAGRRTPGWVPDARPWRPMEPPPDLLQQHLPFFEDQAESLRRIRPKQLESLTRSEPQTERAVQPPIFFPFE
jgi:hypothetical protein